MLRNQEINGTEEIGLVTPTPDVMLGTNFIGTEFS